MKQFLVIVAFFFCAFSIQSQTVKVYVSDSIKGRDGKLFYIHQVTRGQTIYSIAKAYNVSTDELYFENPGSGDGISVDQFLWIPTVNKETELNKEVRSADFEFFYHIIKRGETFSKLATQYNIPVSYIKQANTDLAEPLREGQYVKIPVDDAFTKLGTQANNDPVSFNPNLKVIPDFRHTVVAGETLYAISKQYMVTVDELKMVNPGLAQTIEIGDRLRIPEPTQGDIGEVDDQKKEPQQEVTQEPDYYSHKVKKKETLYSISRIYGVTLQDLYDANSGLTSKIEIGQVIRVPNILIDKPYIIYTASRKTKLSKIAKLYKVPVSMLQKENPSLSSRILPGQKVRIPVGTRARVATEETAKEPEVVEEDVVVESKPVKKGCSKIEPNFEKTFNVALMIPFYLEEMDSLEIDQFMNSHQDSFMPFRFIRFYEGALIAVDSLKNMGYNINLFVYDVDPSITKTAKVLQNPELRKMDLIIGPFQSKSFDQVALFAGNFNIPIVNPFSFRDEVTKKYKSAIKVKSDTKYQADILSSLIQRDHQEAKVYLITHTSYQNVDEVATIQRNIASVLLPSYSVPNTDLYNLAVAVAFRDEEYEAGGPLPLYKFEGVKIKSDSLTTLAEDSTTFRNKLIKINYMKDSLHPFFESASPLRENLAIIYGDNESFFGDAMNRLNEFRDTFNIQVIGMPTPERFRYLDEVQANNMNLTYFSTSFIDYKDKRIQQFIHKFRQQYNTDPDIFGFNGFDIAYYFIDALVNLDDRMRSCFDQYPAEMLLNNYAIKRAGDTGNFENSYWNVIRYERLSRVKLPDPVTDESKAIE